MKASKFIEAHKVIILKLGGQCTPIAEICRKTGISQSTYVNWKKKFVGLLQHELRRLKALDREMLQAVKHRKLCSQAISAR